MKGAVRAIRTIRQHLVPIVLWVSAAVLLVTSALSVAGLDIPTLLEPAIGVPLALAYLLLGGAYEWTIQHERKLDRWYERQRARLETLESNDE